MPQLTEAEARRVAWLVVQGHPATERTDRGQWAVLEYDDSRKAELEAIIEDALCGEWAVELIGEVVLGFYHNEGTKYPDAEPVETLLPDHPVTPREVWKP